MTLISLDKQYETRSKLPVRLYADDGLDDVAIHGAIKIKETWVPFSWYSDGNFVGRYHPYSLVEITSRIELTRWVNVYADGYVTRGHSTKAEAEAQAEDISDLRVACIEIKISCAEGEGI